jgi:hypothetical protein
VLELLESRSLPSTTSPFSGVLDLARAAKITPGDFKNPPSPIGTNPYSSAANVNADTPGDGGAESAPHNETTIAINPTNPLNQIASVNDYQAIVKNNGAFLTVFSRAHVTFDGGHTWTEYPVPFQGYNATGDPAISFDADGTAYLSTLGLVMAEKVPFSLRTCPDIVVAHSTDGGRTWSTPVRVAAGTGTLQSNGSETDNDKPYLAAWGHGNAIVTWTRYDFGPTGVGPFDAIDGPVMASVTHDGGNTWTDPVPISGPSMSTYGPNFDFFNTYAVPSVAADGSIYVAYESFDNEVAPTFRNHYMVVKVDPATGQPLGLPREVSLVYDGVNDYPVNVDGRFTYQASEFRTNAAGNITADPTNALHLAVVWSDMRDNPYPGAEVPSSDPYAVQTNSNIVISQSSDGGQSWSSPTVIQAPGDQFQPWGAYNSSGLLQIGYFDRSYDPVNHKYGYTLASEKKPGSLNFTFQQVTTALSDPTQGDSFGFVVTANPNFPKATTFMGDYSGIAAVSPTLVAALWTDMRLQSVYGGWNEDAFFALVDPPAPGSATTSSAPLTAATAVANPAALLASGASSKALAVDAYFIDLARTSQATSSVTNGDTAPSDTFGLAPPSLPGATIQVVPPPAQVSDTPTPALARRDVQAPADDWGTDVLTLADPSWEGEAATWSAG